MELNCVFLFEFLETEFNLESCRATAVSALEKLRWKHCCIIGDARVQLSCSTVLSRSMQIENEGALYSGCHTIRCFKSLKSITRKNRTWFTLKYYWICRKIHKSSREDAWIKRKVPSIKQETIQFKRFFLLKKKSLWRKIQVNFSQSNPFDE